MPEPSPKINIALMGAASKALLPHIEAYANLNLVQESPDVVVCYGGDGTLLSAEIKWPGIPKVPILNSHRGHRCIPHPPEVVIQGLAENTLLSNEYIKLHCEVKRHEEPDTYTALNALNEINVHMGLINSAVRFTVSLDGIPYGDGREILGDGFVVCTPFGSTAYYAKITRGTFTQGIGVAFKATEEAMDHVVLPDTTNIRINITRGPAVLAFDSAHQYENLEEGDQLHIHKHTQSATILTCAPLKRLDEPF